MKQRILNNKYAVHTIIGKGGMAIVYKGENIETKEIVAIKMLKEEFVENKEFVGLFEKEAEIAKLVRHENMVNTFDVDIDEGIPYMVMEYVQGRTLKEYIGLKGILSEDEAVDIAIKVCDAMNYAHSNKLVHRDIKSQNILISKNGDVKVGDFGIAKMTTSTTVKMSSSSVIGSVHYMSPEQAMGNVVDHTTDIYSLGIVMYEMLTGTLPFKGDTPVSIAMKHVNEGLPSPMTKNHSLSTALDKIIMKTANRHKDMRYQSAEDLKNDLLMSKNDPTGNFVDMRDDDGDTKKMRAIKPGIITERSPEKLEAKEAIDAGSYESEELKQTERDRIRGGIAAARIRKIIGWILFGIVAIIFALGAVLVVMNKDQQEANPNQKHEVPNVEKMLVDEAVQMIRVNGFEYSVEYIINDEYAEDIVISQSPTGGQMADINISIKLKVSKGPELFAVPNVMNISFTEAIADIEEIGFLVGDVSQEVSDLPKEYVVRQEPKAGTEIPIGEKINIWIAIPQEMPDAMMPDVTGRTLKEVMFLLGSMDIGTDRVEVIPIDSWYEKDLVIYHEPEKNKVIEDEQIVTLYISNGKEGQYSTKKHILLSLSNETTEVWIVYVDGEMKQTVYNKALTKGDHDITLTLYTNTTGEKDIIIYYNGVEAGRDEAIFEVLE